MTKQALLFPGQGAQFVGMGRELCELSAAASEVFAQADEALGMPLGTLCFEGPEDALNRTEMAQPALLTYSIAVLRAYQATGSPLEAQAMAGHSLGEWTALVAAGALGLTDAVRLVRLRGEQMQRAVPLGVGAMSAVLGLDADAVYAACEEAAQGEVVVAATFNGRGHIVISGHAGAVARAGAIAKDNGAAAVKALAVSAPFHSPLMAPVEGPLRDALEAADIVAPKVPVRSTTVDGWLRTPSEIRAALVQQLTGPVRWEACLRALVEDGFDSAAVVGAGRAMTRMVKRMRIGLSPRWVHKLPEEGA